MTNATLINKLLYQAESSGLDFKRTQYDWSGKDENKKSEFLKDVLAMANAWREDDGHAYILLGFQSRSPLPAEVVGIESFIDDAHFQQFIGSKVKPKLRFSYEEFEYAGKKVGVVKIPKQKRPFWVEKTYGKVHSNVVYVRRGSSTGEADPVEISQMQEDECRSVSSFITMSVLDKDGLPLGTDIELKSMFLDFGDIDSYPDYVPNQGSRFPQLGSALEKRPSPDYYRKLGKYLREVHGAVQFKFELTNSSRNTLTHGKLEISANIEGKSVALFPSSQLSSEPSPYIDLLSLRSDCLTPLYLLREVSSAHIDGEAVTSLSFERLLPGESMVFNNTLVVLPEESGILNIRGRLLADNQKPVVFERKLRVHVDKRQGDITTIRAYRGKGV